MGVHVDVGVGLDLCKMLQCRCGIISVGVSIGKRCGVNNYNKVRQKIQKGSL